MTFANLVIPGENELSRPRALPASRLGAVRCRQARVVLFVTVRGKLNGRQ